MANKAIIYSENQMKMHFALLRRPSRSIDVISFQNQPEDSDCFASSVDGPIHCLNEQDNNTMANLLYLYTSAPIVWI